MSLPDKAVGGEQSISETTFLWYGPPGCGKTSLATGFPGVFFLATESGQKAHKVYMRDVKHWNNPDDKDHSFTHLVTDLGKRNKHQFKTVAIDTADRLVDLCVRYSNEKLGISHESEAEWGKGWDAVKKEFDREISKLFATGLGVIFISHTKTDEITTELENIKKQTPTLSKQARRILLGLVDVIGYMRMRTIKTGDKKFVKKYVMTFEPSDEIEAKDRTGLLPSNLELDRIPDDVRKTPKIVEEYAKKNFKRIAKYFDD